MSVKKLTGFVYAALFSLWLPPANAFTFVFGHKVSVLNNSLTFHVDIPGLSESGISWNAAFSRAAEQWSMLTPVQLNTVRVASDPCTFADRISSVGFTNTCNSVGAAANAWVVQSASKTIIQSDIMYNSNYFWNVYSGPTQGKRVYDEFGGSVWHAVIDFERVSLHEIGHSLGLNHSIFPRSILAVPPIKDVDANKLSLDDICGVSIAHGRPDLCPLRLAHPLTATGKSTSALFVGGASNDRGDTYKNTFKRSDVIDVMATVVVEEKHFDQPGRLHVVIELSDGITLMKTDNGFAPWDGKVESLKKTSSMTLSGANEIYVLKDFNLDANQVRNIGVAVYVGYSLDAEPGEVYYSGTPIQFRVE